MTSRCCFPSWLNTRTELDQRRLLSFSALSHPRVFLAWNRLPPHPFISVLVLSSSWDKEENTDSSLWAHSDSIGVYLCSCSRGSLEDESSARPTPPSYVIK